MKDKNIRKHEELENVIEKRLFKFANDDMGFLKIMKRIKLVEKPSLLMPPKILFKSFLKGPWEPEIKVSRIILDDINEFNSNDENKLVI